MSSNIKSGGKDSDSVELFQLVRQWLTATEDAISLVGQAIILESDKLQQIQDQQVREPQELQLQQTLQQMKQTQGKLRILQKQIENRAL